MARASCPCFSCENLDGSPKPRENSQALCGTLLRLAASVVECESARTPATVFRAVEPRTPAHDAGLEILPQKNAKGANENQDWRSMAFTSIFNFINNHSAEFPFCALCVFCGHSFAPPSAYDDAHAAAAFRDFVGSVADALYHGRRDVGAQPRLHGCVLHGSRRLWMVRVNSIAGDLVFAHGPFPWVTDGVVVFKTGQPVSWHLHEFDAFDIVYHGTASMSLLRCSGTRLNFAFAATTLRIRYRFIVFVRRCSLRHSSQKPGDVSLRAGAGWACAPPAATTSATPARCAECGMAP